MTLRSVQNLVSSCLPQMRLSRIKTLSWAVLGCLLNPRGLLTEMARAASGGTSLRHKLKRFDRFLSNQDIHIEENAEEILIWLLARRGPLEPALVAMDWTEEHGMMVLCLSLIWERRAVPFYWYAIPKGKLSRSQNTIESTAIGLLRMWTKGRRLIVLADRGFHRTAFIRALAKKYRLDFVIRVIKTTHVLVKGHNGALAKLPLRTGRVRDFQQSLYGKSARVPVRLVAKKIRLNSKQTSTWFLVTSLTKENKYNVVSYYERRMGIEASFRDLKTGFGWRRQQYIKDPERLSRYLLILTMAMICSLVAAERKSGQKRKYLVALQVAWGSRNSTSLVQLGIWLIQTLPDRELSLHKRKVACLWG